MEKEFHKMFYGTYMGKDGKMKLREKDILGRKSIKKNVFLTI